MDPKQYWKLHNGESLSSGEKIFIMNHPIKILMRDKFEKPGYLHNLYKFILPFNMLGFTLGSVKFYSILCCLIRFYTMYCNVGWLQKVKVIFKIREIYFLFK